MMSASSAGEVRRRESPTISQSIVERIADAEGVAPNDLDACLYDVIDPDALNELFANRDTDTAILGTVSFEFHGYDVTVQRDSTVEIDPIQR